LQANDLLSLDLDAGTDSSRLTSTWRPRTHHGLCHLRLEGPPGYKEQPRGPLVAWSDVMVQLL